jgi:c-di-GMP-binding flagellar brake protein YcgR
MIDYAEKRDFHRMDVECAASYRPQGAGQVMSGIVSDLSATGLSLVTEKAATAGMKLNIEIHPGKSVTPPLSAVVEVIRCEDNNGSYRLACRIDQILSADEAGPNFP